ncbi:UNVERIFIED_CONTAM: hypothetical protein FKN15_064298 [Acipenser sinensis]
MEFHRHSQYILEQFNQQREMGLLCDCTFMVDGVVFKAHKAVLAACSQYFRMLFVEHKEVVDLDISSSEGLGIVLDFMYTGRLNLTSETVDSVLAVAGFLQMQAVTVSCRVFKSPQKTGAGSVHTGVRNTNRIKSQANKTDAPMRAGKVLTWEVQPLSAGETPESVGTGTRTGPAGRLTLRLKQEGGQSTEEPAGMEVELEDSESEETEDEESEIQVEIKDEDEEAIVYVDDVSDVDYTPEVDISSDPTDQVTANRRAHKRRQQWNHSKHRKSGIVTHTCEENGPEVYKPPADNIMQSLDIRDVSFVTFPDPISQQGHMDREAPRELIANCRRRALPLEERVKVIKMYAAGRSCRRIAWEYNVGKTQITNIVKIKDSILKDFQSGHSQTRKRKNRGTTTQDEMNSFPFDSKQHEMRERPVGLKPRATRKTLTVSERLRAIQIYEAGRSPLQITKEFDVGRTQVQRVLKVRESVLEDFEIAMHPCIVVKQKTMEKLTFE